MTTPTLQELRPPYQRPARETPSMFKRKADTSDLDQCLFGEACTGSGQKLWTCKSCDGLFHHLCAFKLKGSDDMAECGCHQSDGEIRSVSRTVASDVAPVNTTPVASASKSQTPPEVSKKIVSSTTYHWVTLMDWVQVAGWVTRMY
jgi:hypothetical protein